MEDSRKKLYDTLSTSYNLGTFDEFSEKLNNEDSRRKLYDKVSEKYNLGTYEEYSSKLGDLSQPQDTTAAYQAVVDSGSDNTKEVNTTFGEGFRQEARNLGAGLRALGGEALNLFTGSSLDDRAVLNLLNESEKAGMSMTDYTKQRRMDMLRSFGERPYEESGEYSQRETDLIKQDAEILKAYQDALDKAGGNANQARKILEEEANNPTRGDIMIAKAADTLSEAKENKGWAWLGGLAPQTIGNASAIALAYLSKGRSARVSSALMGTSKALGLGSMASMTGSTAGMSMVEARQSGASDFKVWATGLADAAIEWITEKIPFDNYTKKIYKAAKNKITKGATEILSSDAGREELEKLLKKANEELGGKLFSGKNVLEYIKSAGIEAGSEALAEALQTLTPIIYQNPEEYPELAEVWGNALEGMKGGLVMGAFLGGASNVTSHALNKERRKNQGYVDVAMVQFDKGADAEVVEVLGVDDDSNVATVLRNGEQVNVNKNAIQSGYAYRFSYADFENARLTQLEDEAIDTESVTEGQAKAAGDRVAITATELENALERFSEEEKRSVYESAEENAEDNFYLTDEVRPAYEAYRDALQREKEVKSTLAAQQEKAKDAIRTELEAKFQGPFYQQRTNEDGTTTTVVETGTLQDGRRVYIISEVNEAGEALGIAEDGQKMFVKNDMLQGGTVTRSIVDFLDERYAERRAVAEQERMASETQLRNDEVRSEIKFGSRVNLGTKEAERWGTINSNPNADGAMVLTDDGEAVQLSMNDLANMLNKGAILTDTEKTNAESAEILSAEAALKEERAQNVQQASNAVDEAVVAKETIKESDPLPLKQDGSVDQTTLWNQNPERWAEWNDEQRQDGGVNSLGYINAAITREESKVNKLTKAYDAEPDFDVRASMEPQIKEASERINRLVALQQKYAPLMQAEAQQAEIATEQPAPKVGPSAEAIVSENADPVRQTLTELYNDPDLSESEIEDYINANVEKAQSDLDKHIKKAPKMGTDMAKYKADRAKHQEQTAELEKQRDFWKEVQSYVEVPAVSEMNMEPQNALEFTAKELTRKDGVKLLRDSFARHTGYGSEAGNFLAMLRSKDKGGLSLEEAGERLMEMDRENNTGFFDQNDPNAGLNAILDVISGARTSGDVSGYIRANREQAAKEEVAAARNAMMEEVSELTSALEEDLPVDIFPEQFVSSLDEDMPNFRDTSGQATDSSVSNSADAKKRAAKWAKRLGIKVNVIEDISQVKNAKAREAIASGKKVAGWYETETGEVYIYIPNAQNVSEVDKTIIHEVISHKGLRGLLGKKAFDALCDSTWKAMSKDPIAANTYLMYPGVLSKERLAEYNANPGAFVPTVDETRKAADEFIAHRSESLKSNKSAWEKLIDNIKRMIHKLTGNYNLGENLDELLERSLERYEAIAKMNLEGVVNEGQTYQGIIEAATGAKINPNANTQAEGNTALRADNGSLVGMHNISEDKLRKAIKQGGLANPSTAVVNIASYSLEGFGDISLIMPSSLVDSEAGDNIGTYTGDAWTPTYPTISRQIDDAGWKIVKDRIRAAVGESDDLYHDIVNGVDNYLSDDRNSRLEFVFLKEKGIDPKIELKGADGFVGMRNLEAILGVEGLRDGIESYEKYKAASPMAKRSFNTWQRVDGDKKAHKALKDELRQYPQFAKLMGLGDDLTFAQFDSFTYNIFRKEYDAGNINTTDTLGGASRYVDANDMRTEFEAWLESLMQEAGAKEVFFAGWTRDGDRIYKDNTLENVSRHMRMQGRTNAYDDHGLSATKSALLRRLTSLAEIRKNKARLQDEASYNKAYDELKERLYSVISQLADMEKISDNPFMNIDYAEARLQEAIVKRNPIAYLNSEYGYNIDVKGEYAEELKSFIKDVQKMPAKYFETKFERPVYLNEFAAAVMPTTTSEDIKQAISEAGLPIFEYDSTVEGARREATLKATEEDGVRFRILGEMGAANLDAAEEATIRLDNLDIARQMEEAGKDAKTIKLATGWERGVDNLWRYEVSDEYDLANLEKRLQEELDNGATKTWGIVYPSDLGQLLKEYPEFNVDIMVWVGDEFENTGAYSPATEGDENTFGRSASIEVEAKTIADIAPLLAHEIQHAIQEMEGFAEGGQARGLKDKLSAELDKRVATIKQLREEGRNEEADELMQMSKGLAEAVINNDDDAYGNYKKLAGEVEARNAANRIGKSIQERRESLLSETEDVAREDQIILMDSLGVSEMADGNGGIKLTSSNASILRFDKVNGTNVRDFIDFLRNDKKFEPGKPNVFHIANAGDLLSQFGIKGQFMVGQFTFSRSHTEDSDHELGVKEWIDVINNLNNPIAITSYKGQPGQFRIYTYATINGRNICVGVNVSTKDGSIELSNIISAFGRDIHNLLGKEGVFLLYPATIQELKQKISQVSTAPNPLLNAKSSALSGDKGSNNLEENNTSFRITPEMDKAYMNAVEAGDMETAQRMVIEAARLAMPNTKVVDKKGNPTVVYHGTKGKFNIFAYSREDIGFHFGTKGTARTRIGRGKDARIMQVFLNLENPLIFDTDLGSWDADYIVKDLLKKEMMSYDDAKAILLTPNGYKRNSVSALVDLRQWMSNNGYDGIVYPNWYESNGKDSYIAFSRSQIKSADPVTYDNDGNVIPLSERFNPEKDDIRFRMRGENESAEEFLNTELGRFRGQYSTNAKMAIVDFTSRESIARSLGISNEELSDDLYNRIMAAEKKSDAVYLSKYNTIAIFAREEANTSGKADNIFFHENVHEFLKDNPHWLNLGQWLLDNSNSGPKKAIAERVKSFYPEQDHAEEMLCNYTGLMLSLGRSQAVMNSLPEEMKPIWEEILNKFNYNPEYEDSRRKSDRAGDEDARRDASVQMRNASDERARGARVTWTRNDSDSDLRFRTTEITPEVRDEMAVIAATALVNGNYMKAPNGADTNLTAEQWAMVRTKGFKAWFKDSQVIDENGEPRVVFHGTEEDFTAFDEEMIGENTDSGFYGRGFYFATTMEEAKGYGENVMDAFLSLQNPLDLNKVYAESDKWDGATADGAVRWWYGLASLFPNDAISEVTYATIDGDDWTITDLKNRIDELSATSDTPFADASAEFGIDEDFFDMMGEEDVNLPEELTDALKDNGYDGVINAGVENNEIVALYPSQIKSATDNTGEFSEENSDIRFRMTDSKGNTLTPEQERFFANSKAVDKDGNLLVLYHGTPRAGFTEFTSGWFTTSKEDAISYSGDRKGRLFDPNEKYEPETLTAGDFPLGYMTFDSEEDRAAFLAEYPEAENAISEAEFDSMTLQADEEYDDLIARKPELQKIWNAYREYERERFVDTTIGELIANPEAYTEEDLMRAMMEYDSNAPFDNLSDMSAEERKDALVSALQNANEETEGGIADMVVATRVPRNGEGQKHNDLGNRTYEVYANIENPYEIDANGRGSEFESGDIYKAVERALADEQYDGVIIRNWRVGRYQQLGDVVVPKNGSQIKLTGNEAPSEDSDIRFSIRTKPAPEKTGIGYKVFYLKDGKLYPPMVANQGGVDTPVGVWLDAEEGTRAGESKTGRPKVKQGGKGTQGGSGTLAYRPGWHLGEIPYAIQFNRKDENGNRTLFPADFVWAEVEYANDVNYQEEAMSYGYNANGKFQHSLAGLPKLPTDGSYRYRTNPNPETDPWIITGAMKVNRLLTPSEVDRMVIDAGREPQKRQEGAVSDAQIEALNKELGLVEKEEEVSLRVTGTPTEEVVASGLMLSLQDFTRLAGDIYEGLPSEYRTMVGNAFVNGADLQQEIFRIPSRLVEKQDLTDEDIELAKMIANKVQSAVISSGIELSRPLTTNEALWMLDRSINPPVDVLGHARSVVVADNLGFSSAMIEQVENDERDIRYRAVNDHEAESLADVYNQSASYYKNRLYEVFVDQYDSVDGLIKAIENATGKPAQSFEDVRYTLNQLPAKSGAKAIEMARKYIVPMWDAVKDLVSKYNLTEEKIARYTRLKHGLERNEEFPRRDAREFYRNAYDKKIAAIEADDSLEDFEKQSKKVKAQKDLDFHLESIERGSDAKFQEFREKDYSGIMAAYEGQYDNLADAEQAAREEVESFEAGKDAEITELWKRINALNKATLKVQYESGQMSKALYDSLKKQFQYYVPLRGFMKDTAEDVFDYYSHELSGFEGTAIRAEGRTTEAESPFGHMAAMMSSAIVAGEKNAAKLPLYYFALNRKNQDLLMIQDVWYVKRADSDEWQLSLPPVKNVSESIADYGQRVSAWEESMKALMAEGKAKKGKQNLRLEDVVHIEDKSEKEHYIRVMVNGQEKWMIVNGNPRAAQAINGLLNIESDPYFSKFLGKVMRELAQMSTSYNPEFWMTNLERDLMTTFATVSLSEDKEYTKAFVKNYRKAWSVIKLLPKLKDGTLGDAGVEGILKEAVGAGLQTGYSHIKANEIWDKEMEQHFKDIDAGDTKKAIKSALGKLQTFSESMELVSRFAVYMTSREMGRSIEESVANGKEVTANFNRKGSGRAITFEEAKKLTTADGKTFREKYGETKGAIAEALVVAVSRIAQYGRKNILFFNASIQGLDKWMRLARKNKGNAKKLAAYFGGQLALGFIVSLLYGLDDDDEYQENLSDYDRRNNFMIGGNGYYIKIALPHDVRAFYGMGDILYNYLSGNYKHHEFGESFSTILKQMLSISPVNVNEGWQGLIPDWMSPAVEAGAPFDFLGLKGTNKDFSGMPIRKETPWLTEEELKHTPKYTLAGDYTWDWLVDVSEALNRITGGNYKESGVIDIDPARIQHYIEGWTGGIGRTTGNFATFISQIFGEEEWKAANTPFLNKVFTITDERSQNKLSNSQFYAYRDAAETSATNARAFEKDKENELLRKEKSSDEYKIYQIYNSRYKKAEQEYTKQLKVARNEQEEKRIKELRDANRKRFLKELSDKGLLINL